MKKVWGRTAMRFAFAAYVHRSKMLEVKFENGDHFLVATELVLSTTNSVASSNRNGSRARRRAPLSIPNWDKVRIGTTGDVLEVPANSIVIEIPWDRIRTIVDPDFRAHMTGRAGDRARAIGRRIRALRREAGMTRGTLADKVGVVRQTVAELEAGKIEPELDLIEHIATALGKRLLDFAEKP